MRDENTTRQTVRVGLLLGLMLLVFTTISLYYGLRAMRSEYRTLAAEMGRSFFQAIDTMRTWNLQQGGVYVAGDRGIAPNPYMPEPLRTTTAAGGRKLVMVNHAHMTRLLSELLTTERGVHLHITSMTPLRPANYPDDWERRTLPRFSAGEAEVYDVVRTGGTEEFRYMAPLRMKPDCYTCHPGESRASGAVRGGISVALSYDPFLKSMNAESRQAIVAHVLFFGVGVGILLLSGRRVHKSVAALQESLAVIKRLEGLLPICANCKKIRREGGDWKRQGDWIHVETFIQDRTNAEFTHGLCPECSRKLYPALFPAGQPYP